MSKRYPEDIQRSDSAKKFKLQTTSELDEDEILMLASQAVENDERISTSSKPNNSSYKDASNSYGYSSSSNSHSNRNTFNWSSEKNDKEFRIIDLNSKSHFLKPSKDLLHEQFLKLQDENKKYQEQQIELTKNNIVKDGEISILRAQLKSCQMEIANVKLEKIRNLDRSQTELSDVTKQLNAEMQKQKSELDVKVMEIAQLKEKCRTLESSRVKFTEPTSVANNFKWPGLSQRINSSFTKDHSKLVASTKEVYTQTSKKQQLKLFPSKRTNYPLRTAINNSIYNISSPENPIIFCSNENTQLIGYSNFLLMREKILGNLNGLGKSDNNKKKGAENHVKLDYIYGDLASLMDTPDEELSFDESIFHSMKIALLTKELLLKSLDQLKNLENKISMRILKEMDMKYFELSKLGCDLLTNNDYFIGSAWFKDEQCIDLRRILAVSAVICQHIKPLANYFLDIEIIEISNITALGDFQKSLYYLPMYNDMQSIKTNYLDMILEMLKIILKIRCSHLYTGVLSSICFLISSCLKNCTDSLVHNKVCAIIKLMLMLRPHIVTIQCMMHVLVLMKNSNILEMLCDDSDRGNLKLDFKIGVAVYNEDTCSLQILYNLLETWSTHFIEIVHINPLISITNNLLKFNQNSESIVENYSGSNIRCKCLCTTRLNRCIWVYLRRCASLCDEYVNLIEDQDLLRRLFSTLRAGIMLLYFCILKDDDFLSRLKDYEGYCQIFVSLCDKLSHKLQLHIVHKDALAATKTNMTFVLGSVEESAAENVWSQCFENFSLND